jgi:hypothetical protein
MAVPGWPGQERDALLAGIYTLTTRMLIKLDDQQLGWMAADRARVLASGGGDPLAVGEAARNLAVLAKRPGVRVVQQERGLDAVGGDGARDVGESQAGHARPEVRASDPAGLCGLPGDGGGLGVGGPFHLLALDGRWARCSVLFVI